MPRQVAATAHQPGQAMVVDHRLLPLSALAAERDPGPATGEEADMAVAQRGQAVGTVLPAVGVVPHPQQCVVQQRHDDRQHLLPRMTRQGQVATQRAAQHGQRVAEGDDTVELVLTATTGPVPVVAVLLATADVTPCRLQMPVRIGADPDLAPCRRDRQRPYPRKRLHIMDGSVPGRTVDKAPSLPLAAQSRLAVGDVHQAGAPGIARVADRGRRDVAHRRNRYPGSASFGIGAHAARQAACDTAINASQMLPRASSGFVSQGTFPCTPSRPACLRPSPCCSR